MECTTIRLAGARDRPEIYRLRHAVYATELGQHAENPAGALSDPLDATNLYFVAVSGGEVQGFVSLTPPRSPSWSIDKYLDRGRLPFSLQGALYEVRLLTVAEAHRRGPLAGALMYAAFRWMQSHGAGGAVILGRREVADLYRRVGFRDVGIAVDAGRCRYDVMHATIEELDVALRPVARLLDRLERRLDWRVGVPFRRPTACFHGGSFFESVGEDLDDLDRRHGVINADVLDAWFPPAPSVLSALRADLDWIVRTSPPTGCAGMARAVAAARGVEPGNVLPGAGSSDLIFLALRQWLGRESRALVLDPMYGEYVHVLEQVVRCRVDRLPLSRADGFRLDPGRLAEALGREYDLVVLVNPNSPTGRHTRRAELEEVLGRAPLATRVWIDETYVDYAGPGESLERFAAASENVVVCKSMSKAYALSGLRAGYLCAAPHALEELRAESPPWAVGLAGQLAAVRALESEDWYRARWRETHALRERLAPRLSEALGAEVVPGTANFLLALLPEDGPPAADLVRACRARGLHLRDAAAMGAGLGRHALRVAVKDDPTNARMLEILGEALAETRSAGAHSNGHLVRPDRSRSPAP